MSTSNPGSQSTTMQDTLPRTSSEHFENLEAEWAALHDATPGATIFQHPRWTATWLRHFGEGTAPIYLSVRLEEELVGVIPLDVRGGHARLLGDADVSDFGPILAAPGHAHAVARGLCEWLMEDMTPAATAWGLGGEDPLAEAFASVAPGFGFGVSTEDEAVTPVAQLPGDWESYLASLSKKDRHELRRKLRHVEEAGHEAQFSEATDTETIAASMDRFFELMRASRPDKAEFLTPAAEGFIRDVATGAANLGVARLSTLSLDGHSAAMTLAFETEQDRLPL
ncbi:MAG: GNAT family N-acetyltransferase [Dehalococcoidia bacterium]|nr:GNAT family N-acetyltransferase [Dehalococcoidia bacterium]